MRDIVALQEMERRRIAEELHDTTVQDLVHLSQKLEIAALYMDKDVNEARLEIASARKQIKNIINEIRDVIYDLRPMTLDDIGLNASIERLRDSLIQNNEDILVNFDIDDVDSLDNVSAISIYRIICEGCQNIIKHAHARNMWVVLKVISDKIELTIKDDGNGFERMEKENHFGMQFMKERVGLLSGEIEIISNKNGTALMISIPVTSD